MKQRIMTAVVALILFVPVVWYGSWVLELLMAILGVVGLHELFKMKQKSIFSLEGVIASVGMLSILLPSERLAFLADYGIEASFIFYICVMLLLVAMVFSKNKFNFDDAAVAVLGSLYVGYGFHYFLVAREAGLAVILYMLFLVWSTDSGAYFCGRKFGKNKLAPHISPNKTIEGALGGVVCALVVSVLFLYFNPMQYALVPMLGLTALFSVSGQLGDLVESAYKRHYDVKDSGNLLPGHGGILDRFDSLLFVLPIMHLVGLI
ncbi:phosphatidate cytidylyltransferase [Isobaculum melis]|uniref:Phosphatidate cytidylyltransferase n=1 Tax=Isobaculum melis TaxID=142588 RepID=A0A1H9S1P9_9LACT|nr:phosphatidate cytidylyltransferase [Isobaculum melis]SER78555.1 phosphatidate cytidylyltransferase [Isobaculum melis]